MRSEQMEEKIKDGEGKEFQRETLRFPQVLSTLLPLLLLELSIQNKVQGYSLESFKNISDRGNKKTFRIIIQ